MNIDNKEPDETSYVQLLHLVVNFIFSYNRLQGLKQTTKCFYRS